VTEMHSDNGRVDFKLPVSNCTLPPKQSHLALKLCILFVILDTTPSSDRPAIRATG
jgi:hypothetical protein